ncbi:MAG: 4Fe-4S dicluster domain-containing protein [Candidatus Thorarchaeota archaeon]
MTKEDLFDPYRGRVKVYKKEDIALGIQLLCEQCDAHPCIEACPEGALSRDENTGVITVLAETCDDCGTCVDSCPYNGIRLHPETGKVLICDLCGGDPYCAKHCVPGAIQWLDATDDMMKQKKRLRSARMAMYRDIRKEAA